MKESLQIAKLKARLKLIEQWSVTKSVAMKLDGWISLDDGQQNRRALHLFEGCIWSGARQQFEVTGEFAIASRGDRSPAVILNLGRSDSLEKLAFLYGPEALAEIDGEIVFAVDPNHDFWVLPERFADGATHCLRLIGWTGIQDEPYRVGFIGTGQISDTSRELHSLATLCMETAEFCNDDSLRARLLDCLDAALLLLNLNDPPDQAYFESIAAADIALKNRLSAMPRAPLWNTVACGHGHLDLAWLWQTEIAKGKAARTVSNVLRLMELDPEFRFSQTQGQLYAWIQAHFPALFQQIRTRVQSGQWEILGGMWVEPDCNVTSGESLVRQMLLFHRYMKETFDVAGSPVVWLPDTFGFCAQLPQLMKSAGLLYFASAKLSWNETNKMPAETFRWRGLDGSEVLAHIVSTSKPAWWGATYSADLSAVELCATVQSLSQKHGVDSFLVAYGMGDGGGGPNEGMLRRGALLEHIGIPGLPAVKRGTFHSFFQGITNTDALPIWHGELYFELHRGTYTGQAETKRLNQLCESALHQAEFLAAWVADAAGVPYPHQQLKAAWQAVCLNQFHDILPGSSIHAVYRDVKIVYEGVLEICDRISADSANALGILVKHDAGMIAINATNELQSGFLRLPSGYSGKALYQNGKLLTIAERDGVLAAWLDQVPPYGFTALTQGEKDALVLREEPYPEAERNGSYILENEAVVAVFSDAGELIRWTDRMNDRELIAEGRAALQWQLFEDRPPDWDAWDIDASYREKGFGRGSICKIEPYRIGELLTGLCVRQKIGQSEINQRIELFANTNVLQVTCELDWCERQKLLKISMPLAINNARAAFGTQFGVVERPTHANTSWEEAKYETCMQGFADLSEGDYGVSIASDSKYGVRIFENEISLSVQKGAVFPDETAEAGYHRFAFRLIPHAGSGLSEARRHVSALKRPLCAYLLSKPSGTYETRSMITSDRNSFTIDTIKRAEADDATIVRAYEAENTRGKATIVWYRDGFEVEKTNILEEYTDHLCHLGCSAVVEYNPFEIVTLKLK